MKHGWGLAKKKEKNVAIHGISSRASIAIFALALTLGPLAQGAVAAPPIREHAATSAAIAFNTECPIGGVQCTDTQVLLLVSDGTARVCLDIFTYSMSTGPVGYETGCAPLSPGAFAYDTKNLTGASFSATTVAMQEFACGAGLCQPSGRADRNTVIAATYTGVGLISSFRANSKSTFGTCTMYFVGKGSSREAAASVTIDGQAVGLPGFLSNSAQKSKVICR